MPDAEITVKYLGTNKKNSSFGFIVASEGDTYGCKADQLKQFSTGQVHKIRYHVNEKGYKEFDAILTAPTVKQNLRPVTAPREAKQIGMLAIAKLVEPIPYQTKQAEMTDIMTKILLCAENAYDRVMAGPQQQSRDDMNDAIPFP